MSIQTETSSPPNLISSADEPAPPRKAGVREWLGLALLALPTILLGLDLTLLHLALPALAADLQPTSTQALWIMDAYGFMIAGFLITMGALGDRVGRRRLLMIGGVAFAIASVLAAYSTSAVMLIVARSILGIAGATLMPSTLALITNMFIDSRQRALGFGIWATMFALGMALGPIVGGVLLEQYWWGSAFLIAIPIVVLLIALAPILLPEYKDPNGSRIDLVSVLLSLCTILPVIYGIKQAAKDDFNIATLIPIGCGFLIGIVFVARQRRLSNPLLELTLFKSRAFSVALTVLLFGLVAVGGTMLLVTQYLQLVAGYTPLEAGLWMGPPALAMVAAGIGAPLLARIVRPGFVVAAALVLSAAGYLLLAGVSAGTTGLSMVIVGFSLSYLGLGTIAALGTDLVVGSAPPEKAGSASAMSETVQELGVSLGIAVLGSITTAIYNNVMHDRIPSDLAAGVREAISDSLWAATSISTELPPGLLDEARVAFMTGLSGSALLSAVGVMVLAVLAAATLRHIGKLGP